MKKFFLVVLGLLVFVQPVLAGGAVMKRQNAGKQKAQMQAQRQAQMQAQIQAQAQVQGQTEFQAHGTVEVPGEPAEPIIVEDEVDPNDLIAALKASSQPWTLIINREDKEAVVAEFIKEYADQGIQIKNPPSVYVDMIDGMSNGDAAMLETPFDRVLQIAAIMQYDFDNGVDKDAMARKILGEAGYKKNLQRLQQSQQ